MMGEHRWEKEGKDNHSDPDWNMDYWKIIGARLYQVGKNNKVRLNIIESDNPYNQYKQLVKQAQTGDFTASEIKQLSETINIGVRSYETFNLEAEVEEMKKQVEMMKKNNVTRIKPVVPTKKAN
jgi:negative regulator of sigma E activity